MRNQLNNMVAGVSDADGEKKRVSWFGQIDALSERDRVTHVRTTP